MKIDYDSLARDYRLHRQVQPEVLGCLIRGARLEGGSRVLEVGCGTGNYSIALHEAVGCACRGIEPSERMLAEALSLSLGPRFEKGSAERIDHPEGSFDLVFTVDVIHHVSDLPVYHREAHRVLTPGGALCPVTDSEDIIRHRQPLTAYFPETVEVELRRYPRIDRLRALMEGAGFHDVRDVGSGYSGR